MKKLLILLTFMLSGCVQSIDSSIREYRKAAINVNLGDKKSVVIEKFKNAMDRLPSRLQKLPESYMTKNGESIEIIYLRSLRQPDDLTTDDEYTPYIFKDGILTAIGWRVLGGPKSTGKVKY